jgi:oligopeptide transport system permease protein
VKCDLGPSFKYKDRTVNDIIKRGFPISALLGMEAMLIAMVVGVILGTLAALRHNQWQDWLAMFIAIIGISVPSFVLATFLQYLFSVKLQLLPVARWDGFSHSILPALSLAAFPCAFIARLVRASMMEIFTMDYIKTARSKGLHEFVVIVKHAIKNAILPVITYLGMISTNILTGSFIIEKIFGIPGLGGWFINSITNRDYTVIMGITVFYSVLLLFIIFLVDLLYIKVDPRIKIQE